MFEQISAEREVFGNGTDLLLCGSVTDPPEELQALYGKVQCVYADPPFMTGERFRRRRPYGEKGWKNGSPTLTFPAYADRFTNEKAYLRLLRKLVMVSKDLLQDTGVFCLHLDWRMSAQARSICDKAFGKSRFLNEIIWSYESGGRARRYFSRKHDVILIYARGRNYKFDLTRVPLNRTDVRRNHMARGTDEQGRMFSSIVSHGKEYRYYDDQPVYPGDVWTDISHLQQRDPERTGYATQKPLKLLERLLLPVTEPGDWVVDLCCGSGTTLEAAQRLGCRFAGLDINPEAISVALSRLEPKDLTVVCPCADSIAEPDMAYDEAAGRLTVNGLGITQAPFPENSKPADNLEAWDLGYMDDKTFVQTKTFRRSFRYPELTSSVKETEGDGLTILTTDASGARRVYRYKK